MVMPNTTTKTATVSMTSLGAHGGALALREESFVFDHVRCHDAAAAVMTSRENKHREHSENASP